MARILLVDDDAGVLHAYMRVLRAAGHEVIPASSGREAIAHLRTQPAFDVILSDIAMPAMNGIEFLRAVREHDLDVPVILMTGGPALETAMKAVEYGAFGYLPKPIEPEPLHEIVERASRLHAVARLKRQALEIVGAEGRFFGDRAVLEPRFDRALERLWIAFQPIVSWSERRIFGYEALLRSDEPTLASPAGLLPVAERLGRLQDLGRAIRERVAAAVPQAPADAAIFLNLHALDLEDEALYEKASPLAPFASRVVLEVTERASLEGVREVRARVAKLRALGYRIAVDDLGAGYAGLATFTQLDPAVVKFDMSLIRNVDTDPKKQKVIRSITELCAGLGMQVIGEGVETIGERDTLTSLGCDLLQGYLFARPTRGFVTGSEW